MVIVQMTEFVSVIRNEALNRLTVFWSSYCYYSVRLFMTGFVERVVARLRGWKVFENKPVKVDWPVQICVGGTWPGTMDRLN